MFKPPINVKMTEEQIKFLLGFMERVNLTGREVNAFNQAVAPLIQAMNPQTKPEEREEGD